MALTGAENFNLLEKRCDTWELQKFALNFVNGLCTPLFHSFDTPSTATFIVYLKKNKNKDPMAIFEHSEVFRSNSGISLL